MSRIQLRPQTRVAILLGTICSICYLAVYFARNILSTFTPQMIEDGMFSEADIGALSSVFFITYAVGQLVNGLIGDRIKAKYMICFGLLLSGGCNLLFSLFAHTWTVAYLAYALTGFFLSMIYAPMSKMVTENTEPIHAVRCSIAYTFAAFFGSPLAGITAVIVSWQGGFGVASGTLIVMGFLSFIFFSVFERRGEIRYGQYQPPKGASGGIKILLERQTVRFTLVAILTRVVRTTAVFWMPTYFVQYLGCSTDESALIFTVVTAAISVSAFLAVWLYEKLFHYNMNVSVLVYFLVSAVAFLGVFVFRQTLVNIILMVIAIIMANCASSILWSCYCLSLRDTGLVSGATGFLDFASYIAASVASSVFAAALPKIGWSGLIISWFALMAIGAAISMPLKLKNHKSNKPPPPSF